jgi:hypothetical protein
VGQLNRKETKMSAGQEELRNDMIGFSQDKMENRRSVMETAELN